MAWHKDAESRPVCVLAQTSEGVFPVFWSDYNPKRKLPNFVAYINSGRPRAQKEFERKWRKLPGFVDKVYYPGELNKVAGSHCVEKPDCACAERVSSRGHL